jgi:hypothetical protein
VNDLQRVGVGYVEYCSSQLHRSFKLDVGGRDILHKAFLLYLSLSLLLSYFAYICSEIF